MKTVSERCERANWEYNDVGFEVKKEIPAYMGLGLYPEATKQMGRALELRRRVLGAGES